jgi:hypothetical protein
MQNTINFVLWSLRVEQKEYAETPKIITVSQGGTLGIRQDTNTFYDT